MYKKVALLVIFGGLFLFSFDRWFKWQATHGWSGDQLIHRWLGWHPFTNPGMAFGIPVPPTVIIALTVPIIVLIVYQLMAPAHRQTLSSPAVVGLAWIGLGASSNLLDRLVYGFTIDYLLIFTGVFNLADALIIGGGLGYLLARRQPPATGHPLAH